MSRSVPAEKPGPCAGRAPCYSRSRGPDGEDVQGFWYPQVFVPAVGDYLLVNVADPGGELLEMSPSDQDS